MDVATFEDDMTVRGIHHDDWVDHEGFEDYERAVDEMIEGHVDDSIMQNHAK